MDDNNIPKWQRCLMVVLAPVVISVVLLVLSPLIIAGLLSIPYFAWQNYRFKWRERKLRKRMMAAGRVVDWTEIRDRFASGAGTLIVEVLEWKMPVRDWWTEEDVISSVPIPLDQWVAMKHPRECPESLREFARSCVPRYTDPITGTALLTAVPDLPGQKARSLAEQFPSGKVVMLFPKGVAIMFGDYEAWLFPPTEKPQG